jgi:dTDP-4-amino-4,6-dideoxygalactose transaminase
MAAILINVKPGDEVIIPSYTFVSSANAFILRGATAVFSDSRQDHPGIDEDSIEELITEKTKAIVVVHYAGIACDMDKVMELADQYNLYVIEDAAHAIDSYYRPAAREQDQKPLGSIGHLAAFSFHETKNISSGEGGMISVNDPNLMTRAEIVWEKGTDRASFFRGEIDKYGWKDIGSSFLPSELTAAFLWGQLQNIKTIQARRKEIWNLYDCNLRDWAIEHSVSLPVLPGYAVNNAHMYFIVMNSRKQRDYYINGMKQMGIQAIFHYQSLHNSTFYRKKHDGRRLPQSDRYSDTLMRLPFFYELTLKQIETITTTLIRL